MMAADSSKFPAWFIVLIFLLVSAAFSSAQGNNGTEPCIDGTYKHEGRTCCRCGAGLQVEEHCTTSIHGKCKACDDGTYSSYPLDPNDESCERCTSCDHPNVNLEVDVECTRARDAKCRCKEGHYCNTEPCQHCNSCTVCDEGVEVECTLKSDTVCKDKTEGGNHVGIAVGIPVAIVLLIGLAVLIAFFWKKYNRKGQLSPVQPANGSTTVVEMQPLKVPDDLDIQCHLPDIADVIGWKAMKEVAMRSGIPPTSIDACQDNRPNDSREQTIELLKDFVERNGKEAANNLFQTLKTSGKRDTAEKVKRILTPSA